MIVTREDLPKLPYSVDEIYGIHTSGKYHDLKRTYNELYRIYSGTSFLGKVRPEAVVVEDSNSGYEFFKAMCDGNGVFCTSAGGKSNLKEVIESFEWLILKTGVIDGKAVQEILDHPEDFIESKKYFSWERFFTVLLMEYTQGSYLRYNKSKLNEGYLHEKVKRAILDVMEGVEWCG